MKKRYGLEKSWCLLVVLADRLQEVVGMTIRN